jgi:hypothetical protein
MKYLFLIIRHFFPRRRWREVRHTKVFTDYSGDRPGHILITMEDQFGNQKVRREG